MRLTPSDIPNFDAGSRFHHAALNSLRLGGYERTAPADRELMIARWLLFVGQFEANGSPLLDTLPLDAVPASFDHRDPDHHLAWWAFSFALLKFDSPSQEGARALWSQAFGDWAAWAPAAAEQAVAESKAALVAVGWEGMA